MKLHLNLTLRRALLAAMAAVATFASSATAGVMHSDATYQTYTDFGQNKGRYVVGGNVNALLSHIREKEGGITIDYTDGNESFLISNEQGMISFNGTHDAGHSAVISPTFIATVLHNGSLDGSFSERTVGSSYAINYEAIDIRGSQNFRLAPTWGTGQYDYMLQRQSKVVTDVTWNQLTTLTNEQIENLDGGYIYHSGSGTMYQWDEANEKMVGKAGPYTFIIGAINGILNGQVHADGENISIHQNPDYIPNDGASVDNPLPNGVRPGDSGSPTFIYNPTTGKYEYIAAQQSAGAEAYGQARGNVEWTQETLNKFDVNIDMSEASTIHLGAVNKAGETITETLGDKAYSTTLYSGLATDANGKEVGEYVGVQTGVNTWTNLLSRKDINNWYAYENKDYTMGSPTYGQVISDLNVSDADLFYTQNLVFTPSQSSNNIVLDATVDLGIGYAEFNKGENMEDKAVFNITAGSAGTMFNHAGYVINEGAEVHLKLTNPDTHMTEWRKTGAGDLYIDGTGNTNALLNVGGSGKTYLNQDDGHAAYNVLVNSGATVVIGGINQIERDLTFGAGGGTLDMNGNSMNWYTSDGESRDGFTIQALTEEAMITNTSKTPSTLTYMQGGNTTYKGSFADTATGALSVVYSGGGTWTLNGIHTDLSHWVNSGFTVANGKVILSGTNTVHGMGSATAINANRLQVENDWHYADAAMGVEIASGATFELGSHARLTGYVYLYDGGTFIIREAVKHQYEYVEGGSKLEDTYKYADYYGYKGDGSMDILLAGSNSALKIEYSEGTTANTSIAAKITGKGSVSVDTGLSGGTLTLSGANTMSGTKTLISGGLIAESTNALGDTSDNKWKVQDKGWIASHKHTGAELLDQVDSTSTGVLALSSDTKDQLNLSGHKSLYVGAETGKTIEYGEKGTSTELTAQEDGAWRLGGGGGTLNVNFLLAGKNNLIIGNTYSSGTVHLANTGNTFSGDIIIMGTGNLLTYADVSALGSARVALSYGNTLAMHQQSDLGLLKSGAQGVMAVADSFGVDLTGYGVALGAVGDVTFTDTLTVGDMYRLGGSGNLILDTALDSTKKILIDGQGNSGSAVTFARENAYSGDIVAGGGMNLETPNSTGSVGIHAGHDNTFAATNSVELRQGAVLYTDGHANMVVQNLTAQTGAGIVNNGTTASSLELRVTQNASIADGVLNDANNSASLSLVKTGEGNLSMAGNKSWSGGLTIQEGQVTVNAGNGGVGSSANIIQIEDKGTLRVEAGKVAYGNIGQTIVNQTITGTGTIVAASGGNMLLTQQAAGFEGTVHVTEGTRLYVGKDLTYIIESPNSYNNVQAFDNATIKVDSGSQVRVTNNFVHVSQVAVVSHADYSIAGSGLEKATSSELIHEGLIQGALSIDCGATIMGNVTLDENATIASWSKNPTEGLYRPTMQNIYGRYYSRDNGTPELSAHYGIKGYLGGTIRGQILGEGKDLTIGGNEGMTFTADSANTFRNLNIANGNGNNTEKFALCLDGGKAVSQTYTALGTGNVSLNDGLILRLAGTGMANQTDVEYTYENNIAAGNGATIQSYNITNKLTGTITIDEVLNLSTGNGGVLELAGYITGNGKLNIGSDSVVVLSGSQTFGGSVTAEAGATLTLASTTVMSESSAVTGTSMLNLHLSGTADFKLGNIVVNNSDSTASSTLNLRFDFTGTPNENEADSWSSLTSSITADSTVIGLELNMFDDLRTGDYVLVTQAGENTEYSLADTMGGRLSLDRDESGALVLHVGADDRLYWTGKQSSNWNSDLNWTSEKNGDSAYKAGAYVMLDFSQVDSADESEAIVLGSGETTVSTLAAQKSSYEIRGEGQLSGEQLVVGNKADLKLSNTGGSSFRNGVTVNDAKLEVSAGALTANVTAENGADFILSDNASMTGNLHLDNANGSIRNAALVGNVTTAGSGTLVLSSASVKKDYEFRFDAGTLNVTSDSATVGGSFTFAQGQTQLQVQGMSIASGGLSSTAALDIDTLAISGDSLTLTHAAGTTTEIDTITGNGSLFMNSAGDLKLRNANLSGMTLKGGGITTISGSVNLTDAPLSIGKQTLNLVNGANVTVKQFIAGNTADDQPSQINIGAGASLSITGNTDVDGDFSTGNSFLLAHWKRSDSSIVLNGGTLTALNTRMMMGWNSKGQFDVRAGTANLKGIRFVTERDYADTLLLGTEDSGSGRINLGSSGITGIDSNDTVNLGNGTIGALADFAISNKSGVNQAINLVGTSSGTTFDTAGHTITVNTALAGSGNLIKAGEGTLKLAGSGAQFSGNISVESGALAVDSVSKDIFASASSITIDNGTLDLSAIDFSESSQTISLSTQLFISSDSTLALGNLQTDTTYNFFNTALENWTSLGMDNFTIGGIALSDMGRVSLALGMDGSFSYSIDRWNLTWQGDSNDTWDMTAANKVWQTTRLDETTGAESTFNTGFCNGDNVIFTSNANVTLGQPITAGTVTISNNAQVTLTEGSNALTASSIVVESGARLTFATQMSGVKTDIGSNITGSGTVVLNLSGENSNWGNKITMNSAFTGEVHVNKGCMTLDGSYTGSKLVLLTDSADLQLTTTTNQQTSWSGNLELRGTHDVHSNSSTDFEFMGHVSGTGTYVKKSSGKLTFGASGSVNLGKFQQSEGDTIFAGTTTLGALDMTGGKLKVQGDIEVTGRLNVSGGMIETISKELKLCYTGEDGNVINILDGGCQNNIGKGSVRLLQYVGLNVKEQIWGRSESSIILEKDAVLTHGSIAITNKGSSEATLKASTGSGNQYGSDNTNWVLTNGHIKSTASGITISNKLTNSSVENAGGGTLTVTNGANTLSGVVASKGDVTLQNLSATTSLNLLEIADGRTVNAYVGADANEKQTVTVSGTALLSGTSTLNTSLTLNAGATLDMVDLSAGAAIVTGALTFDGQVTMGNKLLAILDEMSSWESNGITLFTGLTSFTFNDELVSAGSVLQASTIFSNVQAQDVYMEYHFDDNVGSLIVSRQIPEPTTATLSLLALAGLCARRRRKV